MEGLRCPKQIVHIGFTIPDTDHMRPVELVLRARRSRQTHQPFLAFFFSGWAFLSSLALNLVIFGGAHPHLLIDQSQGETLRCD